MEMYTFVYKNQPRTVTELLSQVSSTESLSLFETKDKIYGIPVSISKYLTVLMCPLVLLVTTTLTY